MVRSVRFLLIRMPNLTGQLFRDVKEFVAVAVHRGICSSEFFYISEVEGLAVTIRSRPREAISAIPSFHICSPQYGEYFRKHCTMS